MYDVVKSVTKKLSGSSGPGGMDLEALQGWILKFWEDSKTLCTRIDFFVNWMVNESSPWAAYRAFMPGRLIVLNKQPDVRLVGVVEIWRHLFAKIALKVTGPEATMAFQVEQMCTVLKAVIHGAFHGV